MRDQHKRGALVARQLQHQGKHTVGGRPVQIASGLVGQYAGGFGDQCARNRNALSFAAGQFRRAVVHTVLQTHAGQRFQGRLRRFGRWHTAYPQRHGYVVQCAELGQQMVKLVHKTEVAIAQNSLRCRCDFRQVLPHQLHAATGGCVQCAQQMQQGALARTGGSHDGQSFAAAHAQIDALQHGHIKAAFGEAFGQTGCRQYHVTHNAMPRQG